MIKRNRCTRAADVIAAFVVWAIAITVTAVFAWIIIDVARRGAGHLSWSFLTQPPGDAGRAGGIGPILVSTGAILLVCLGVSLPLGIGTAALLAEFTRSDRLFSRLVRRSLDVLAGVPSIVFGLFGNAFFCIVLGMGYSIAAGGLTLACMVLPILIRTAEEGFRSAAEDHRRAAAALGLSRTTTLLKILLPLALPGVLVGLVLGIGRALAETAALLFTAGYVARMPTSVWDSGRALTVHIYELSKLSGGDPNAYASALVLVAVLLVINTAARLAMQRLIGRSVIVA